MADRSNGRGARDRGRSDRALIQPGDRLTLVGTAGSGKSTLLVRLIRRYQRAVLIDYKGDDPIPDWHHVRGVAQFQHDFPAHPRVVVQREAFGDDVAWFDAVCRHCFRVGNVAVGIDDLPPDLTVGGKKSPGLEELYKLGRSRRITTVAAIQRPSAVPLVMLSEASALVLFRVHLEEDRRRLAGVIGPFPQPRTQHGFTYARPGSGDPAVECAPLEL